MNSDVVASSYANSSDMTYGAHYATLASSSVSYENPTAKFIMEYITPNATTSKAYDKTLPKAGTSNVVNNNKLGTTRITTSNYIELTVPKHLFYITNLSITANTYGCGCSYGSGIGGCNPVINITRKTYSKGQKFVVVNAGGNVDNPVIVGVVE